MYKEGNSFLGNTFAYPYMFVGENLTEGSRLVPTIESFLPGPYYFF